MLFFLCFLSSFQQSFRGMGAPLLPALDSERWSVMGVASELCGEMLARRGSCCLSACPWHSASHSSHSKAAELCLPRGQLFSASPPCFSCCLYKHYWMIIKDCHWNFQAFIFVYLVVIIQSHFWVLGAHFRNLLSPVICEAMEEALTICIWCQCILVLCEWPVGP